MRTMRWINGEHTAVITPQGVFVLEQGNDDLATTMWNMLNAPVTLSGLMQTLMSQYATDLSAMPSFAAIIVEDDTLHVAIRGIFHLTAQSGDTHTHVANEHVITWEERHINHVTHWAIDSQAPGSNATQRTTKMIIHGVVPVSHLETDTNLLVPDTDQCQEAAEEATDSSHDEDIHRTRAYLDVDFETEDEAEIAEHLTNASDNTNADHAEPVKQPETEEQLTGLFADLWAEHTIEGTSIEAAAVRNARNDDNAIPTQATEAATNEKPEENPADKTGESLAEKDAAQASFVSETADLRDQEAPDDTHGNAPNVLEHPEHSTAPEGFFIDSVPTAQTPNVDNHDGTDAQGWHDGQTIRSNHHEQLRRQAEEFIVNVPQLHNDAGTIVALMCVNGHPNPTHANTCNQCGGQMSANSERIAQPTLGTLAFSTGDVVTLDRDVVVGRRPKYTPQPGRTKAHIVPVPSPNQEISRTHCQITVDGWDVHVHDLGSNNGTFVHRPGQDPIRVIEGTPVALREGDVIDLGDTVSIRMDGQ